MYVKMKLKLNHIKVITDYLQGNLSKQAESDFENTLQKDESLEGEVALMCDVFSGIEAHGDDEFRKMLQGIENELDKEGFFQEESWREGELERGRVGE
jgi:Tfp pilus assembly protein PilF